MSYTEAPTTPARWHKFDDGSFGISHPGEPLDPGTTVPVRSRSGSCRTVTIDSVIRQVQLRRGFPPVWLYTIVNDRLTTFRWGKDGDDWVVRGPFAEVGDEIVITKADGTTTPARVVAVRQDGVYDVEKVEAQPACEVEPGQVYVTSSDEIVRTQWNKEGTRWYTKVWHWEDPDRTRGGWEYDPSAKGRIVRRITAEEAAEWGVSTEKCVFCNRKLKTKASLTVGYGPDCAEDRGLPWDASLNRVARVS